MSLSCVHYMQLCIVRVLVLKKSPTADTSKFCVGSKKVVQLILIRVVRGEKSTLHLFHTFNGTSGTDVSYISCFSSPSFFYLIRFIFISVLISTLFACFFSILAYIHIPSFNGKNFLSFIYYYTHVYVYIGYRIS